MASPTAIHRPGLSLGMPIGSSGPIPVNLATLSIYARVFKAWGTEGHSVALPGLGTMRFGLRAKSVASAEEVKAGLISTRRIIFTPTVDLKDELASTAIQITCYDRTGKEVKRVTSTDPGTVEDPENENQNGNQNQSGSGSSQNQGGNTSGGDNTGGGNSGGDNGGSGGMVID